MNEFAICDYFKWRLEDVRNLTIREFKALNTYLKHVNKKSKEATNKAKHLRKR